MDIDDAAKMNGDMFRVSRTYFNAHPQYWKSDEFSLVAGFRREEIRASVEEEPMGVEALIREKARDQRQWPMAEMANYPGRENQLPPDGVMTHLDYTSYAHAMLVRRLIGKPRYIDVYMDQDEVLRGAYVTALNWRIAMGDVDMAYVQFHKHMDIDLKRALANACEPSLLGLEIVYGRNREEAISRHMADLYERQKARHVDWRNRWVPHPRDTLNEPERRILYLADTGDKDLEDIGWTLSGATLAPVDNYFMRIRRGLQYLERPIPSHTNAEKLYYGYSAYDPRRVAQYLEIFRVYLPHLSDGEGTKDAFWEYWSRKRSEAFDRICEEEDLDPERFADLIEAYQFSDKEPLTDELMKVVNTVPSILQRKKVAKRIISRMVDYIETFEENMGDLEGA